MSATELVNEFQTKTSTMIDEVFPLKKVTVSDSDKPWMTEDLREELMFVLTHLPSWNGAPLRRPNRIHYFRKDPSIITPSTVHFVGDAGQEAAAIYSASHRNK